MANSPQFEIIPNQAQRSEPVFKNPKEHEEFRRRYAEAVLPKLEKANLARARSEHDVWIKYGWCL